MDKIRFTFEETGEEVIFCILSSIQLNDIAYVLAVPEAELDDEEPDAYILKAVEADDIDVYYDIVDNDEEINKVLPGLEKQLGDFEIES